MLDSGRSNSFDSNPTSQWTPEQQECESHFQLNTFRTSTGRFVVKLPVNGEKIQRLGDSLESARLRFFSLERRLLTQPDILCEYRSFMREYLQLNHMREVVNTVTDQLFYYLPHHVVLKKSNTTTKSSF